MKTNNISKYLLISSFGIILILFSRCVSDGIITAEYKYSNQTSHTILLKEGKTLKEHVIKPDSTLILGEGYRGDYISDPMNFEPPFIDSLVYDDIKCFTLNETEYLNSIEAFEIEELGMQQVKFVYTFTEEDYLKAEDCN